MLLLCACGHECSLKKLVKPSLRKKYNKNTYRYFSKHQLVSRWLPPREQTLPATLCLFKYAPRGCCRKYFKQKVQQLAAEKAEIFNWKCIWKTSKSPMQRVKVVNVLWYTYTYHIGVFNIQQNTEQSHKYTIYQQLTTYPWIIFKRQYCNFLPAISSHCVTQLSGSQTEDFRLQLVLLWSGLLFFMGLSTEAILFGLWYIIHNICEEPLSNRCKQLKHNSKIRRKWDGTPNHLKKKTNSDWKGIGLDHHSVLFSWIHFNFIQSEPEIARSGRVWWMTSVLCVAGNASPDATADTAALSAHAQPCRKRKGFPNSW